MSEAMGYKSHLLDTEAIYSSHPVRSLHCALCCACHVFLHHFSLPKGKALEGNALKQDNLSSLLSLAAI
jgi:hypothetical protein